MSEIAEQHRDFLHFWFEGFSEGLARMDDSQRGLMLRECGKACARSYTAGVFQEEWEKSGDLKTFLTNLTRRFPGSSHQWIGEDKVEIGFEKCTCDLVTGGFVTTPLLCECSVQNMKENFESCLHRPVDVRLKSSVLGGAERCALIVDLS